MLLAAAARDNDLLKQEYEHMVRSNEDLNSQLLESKKEIRQLELIVQRQPLNNVVGSEVNGGSSKRTEELEEALHKATLMQRSLLADHQARLRIALSTGLRAGTSTCSSTTQYRRS